MCNQGLLAPKMSCQSSKLLQGTHHTRLCRQVLESHGGEKDHCHLLPPGRVKEVLFAKCFIFWHVRLRPLGSCPAREQVWALQKQPVRGVRRTGEGASWPVSWKHTYPTKMGLLDATSLSSALEQSLNKGVSCHQKSLCLEPIIGNRKQYSCFMGLFEAYLLLKWHRKRHPPAPTPVIFLHC